MKTEGDRKTIADALSQAEAEKQDRQASEVENKHADEVRKGEEKEKAHNFLVNEIGAVELLDEVKDKFWGAGEISETKTEPSISEPGKYVSNAFGGYEATLRLDLPVVLKKTWYSGSSGSGKWEDGATDGFWGGPSFFMTKASIRVEVNGNNLNTLIYITDPFDKDDSVFKKILFKSENEESSVNERLTKFLALNVKNRKGLPYKNYITDTMKLAEELDSQLARGNNISYSDFISYKEGLSTVPSPRKRRGNNNSFSDFFFSYKEGLSTVPSPKKPKRN